MAKLSSWDIEVAKKDKILASFKVPAHKLQKRALEAFLKAVVARYRSNSVEDMLYYYVNKTKGAPTRLPFAEVKPFWNADTRREGYWCGEWECHATATYMVSIEQASFIEEEHNKNRHSRG